MFNATYTGMVFIFLVIQLAGFGVLVWFVRKKHKELSEAVLNVKEQNMTDIRALVAIVKAKGV